MLDGKAFNQKKDQEALIVGKTHRHACTIFQACGANFLPVDTQVLFFLHFAVKIDIKDG